jgi:hypothetical protein
VTSNTLDYAKDSYMLMLPAQGNEEDNEQVKVSICVWSAVSLSKCCAQEGMSL